MVYKLRVDGNVYQSEKYISIYRYKTFMKVATFICPPLEISHLALKIHVLIAVEFQILYRKSSKCHKLVSLHVTFHHITSPASVM
jgi:hypothetical protein